MWIIIFILVVALIGGFLGASHNIKKSSSDRNKAIDNAIESGFDINRHTVISPISNTVFSVDTDKSLIGIFGKYSRRVIPFAEIVSIEIIEDGETIYQKGILSTASRMVAGGILLGGIGAVAGGLTTSSKAKELVSQLSVKIKTNNIDKPTYTLTLFDSRDMTPDHKPAIPKKGAINSYMYQQAINDANQIKDLVDVIISQQA